MSKLYRSHIFQWLLVLGIIMIITLWITHVIGNDVIVGWVIDTPWAVPFFIFLKALTVVFAPLSGGVLYVIAPIMWPGWLALLYVSIGNVIGISIAYWLWYRYADRAIQRFVGKKSLEQAHHIIDNISGYRQFLIVRIVFFPLEDLVNFVAGMAKVPFWWFLLVSMIITTTLFGLFILGFGLIQQIL